MHVKMQELPKKPTRFTHRNRIVSMCNQTEHTADTEKTSDLSFTERYPMLSRYVYSRVYQISFYGSSDRHELIPNIRSQRIPLSQYRESAYREIFSNHRLHPAYRTPMQDTWFLHLHNNRAESHWWKTPHT